MWMTPGGGNGDTGVGNAAHSRSCWLHWFVSLIYVVVAEVVVDPVYIFNVNHYVLVALIHVPPV